MKNFLIIISIILILSPDIYSQGGSNYSVNGIGDLNGAVSAASNGLAGTQIAFPSDYSINSRNPAMWSFVQTTRLQAGYMFNQNVAENSKISLYQNNGKVNGILGLFAIDTTIGLSVSFGIQPYSSVNYMLLSPFGFKVEGIEMSGTTTYEGIGGISIGYIGIASKLFDKFAVGAQIFGNFGSIKTQTYSILDGSDNYVAVNNKVDNFYGLGFKAGLTYQPFDALIIGICTEYQPSLKYDRNIYYRSQALKDSSFTQINEFKMPALLGFGLSYKSGKFVFGADVSMQDFSKITYQKGEKVDFRNNINYSLGISRLGNRGVTKEILDKITYNIGFAYKQLYYKVNGTDINEMYGSVGLEIPIVGGALLSSSFQLGKRGTTNNGLIKESFGRLTVDISLGDSWFKPFKREYE